MSLSSNILSRNHTCQITTYKAAPNLLSGVAPITNQADDYNAQPNSHINVVPIDSDTLVQQPCEQEQVMSNHGKVTLACILDKGGYKDLSFTHSFKS